MLKLEEIAKITHETNRVYCQALGDYSQTPWEEAPEWQKQSAIAGVKAIVANPAITPPESHESWLIIKKQEGWVYGEVKNPEKKEHPCMVPYSELPKEQRVKDALFSSIVKALSQLLPEEDRVFPVQMQP